MKILVITGSSHHPGTSEILADNFIMGAQESGNEITRFDAGDTPISPLTVDAKNNTANGNETDRQILTMLNDADMVVLVTPLYYFGMTAQLKAVIDRMYQNNQNLIGNKYAMLLATAYGDGDSFDALVMHYHSITRYMKWTDQGMLLAGGCSGVNDVNRTNYPSQAYQLGKQIKLD
ncbi:NAD(P)H-dependent oxidoreductase [Paucilactobacillus suebicus]|uniref:NAD(P)H dehydrogenase (Quinone) n=1 Tax=Paucilactobacillus suebicus DSM 5007 = KCTC 3549 TaxID=1423807 RepID=A0A0R1WFR3_9LACO|nr:NAD(P)H-dependent oxidoreductase [Paucilactobacillus suebicus]KRM12844.1 NAD(P)H dehydrogenase (quinone) [Paucilactobacillus suebicus DSM 5007 = KCTC 3549]